MKSSLRFAASLALALSAAAATACKHEEQAPPLPEGLLLSGESDDVQRILARFASLSGTPIAEAATAARARTASCTTVEARSTAGFAALFAALACDETPAFQALRGAKPVLFVLPPQGDHRFIGRGSVDDAGDVTIDGLLEPVPHAPQPALFLPSAEAPRTQLSDADRALWLAANLDGGLDIARLVPAGSQASTLFMLDSAMLSKAVLNGNIEAAVYVPPERGGFPPVVIAFGVRSMAAAVAAMDLVVERVSQTFQVAPVPYAIGDRRGSCLPGVNILPELAPCYAALPDAIVIGWNARALEHALAPSTHPAPQRTTIAADFAAFARADDVLQKTLLAEGQPVIEQQYPWSKLDVTMGKGAEGYAMSLHLAGATQ